MADPIDDFMALPRDQQLSTLSSLPQERQDWILGQVAQRHAKPTATVSAAPSPYSLAGIEGKAMTLRDWLVNQLPVIGGTAGGVVGAGAGAGPASLATGALGAAAGGGLGEVARQGLTEHFHPEDKPMTGTEAATGIGKEAAGQGAAELVGAGIGRVLKPTMASTINKLYHAGDLGPGDHLEAVMPEIMEAEKAKPVKTVKDFVERVGEIKKKIGTEVDTALRTPVQSANGPVAVGSIHTSGQPIADQITMLIQNHPSDIDMNPAKIKAIKDRALMYQQPRTFQWLNDRRTVLNNELNRFYALKTPADQALYLSQHPNFEIDKAEADAIRDIVYPAMDNAAQKPTGYFENLQKKRGALISVERQTQENLDTLVNKNKKVQGAPIGELPRAYATSSGKVGMTTRLTSLVHRPNVVAKADKQVSRAFGHTPVGKVGSILQAVPASNEVLSLPFRELVPEDQYQPATQ